MTENRKLKTITVCGSLKFQKTMLDVAERMAVEGNCVLTPVFPSSIDIKDYTAEQKELLGRAHKEKSSPTRSLWLMWAAISAVLRGEK